jgi:DNA-binding MarR family transcriptional regulator
LERRGLAKRISAKNDRRAHALYLTEDGEKLVARWRAEQHKLEKQLIEIVGGEGNYRQLMQTLDKLADNLAPE